MYIVGHVMLAEGSRRLMVYGGLDSDNVPASQPEILSLECNQWTILTLENENEFSTLNHLSSGIGKYMCSEFNNQQCFDLALTVTLLIDKKRKSVCNSN